MREEPAEPGSAWTVSETGPHIGITGFDQFSEYCAARIEIVFQPEHWHGNLLGFRAGQADDANSSATRRRGNRNDGVVEAHGTSFEFLVSSFKRESWKTVEFTEVSSVQACSQVCNPWDKPPGTAGCLRPGFRCADRHDREAPSGRCGVRAKTWVKFVRRSQARTSQRRHLRPRETLAGARRAGSCNQSELFHAHCREGG